MLYLSEQADTAERTTAVAASLETLTAQYVSARTVAETAQLGPRTDKAQARMEAVMVKAEKAGLVAELTAALGY